MLGGFSGDVMHNVLGTEPSAKKGSVTGLQSSVQFISVQPLSR